MKKLPRFDRRALLGVLLTLSLVTLSISPLFISKVLAGGTLTHASVTISDSRAALASVQYNFAFTTSVTTDIKQLDIQFCDAPSGSCNAPDGLSTTSVALVGGDNLAGTGRTTTHPSASTVREVVTTPASQSTQAVIINFSGITNPSTANTTSYAWITTYSDTGSTVIDTVSVAFAVLDTTSITVTASVDPTLTFAVAPATSGSVNGAAITVAGTTATSIPFGTLAANTAKVAAHDISVTTNAQYGYAVTVKALADPPLVDGSNNLDKFTGTNGSPTSWSAPDGTTANVNTGFFGYTSNDATLTNTGDGVDRFTSSGGDKWAGTTTAAAEVAYSNVATPETETTRIGWEAEVNTYQPNGSYSGTVILVATPTY